MGVKIGNIWYGTEGVLVLKEGEWQTYFGQKNTPGPGSKKKGGSHVANFINGVMSRKKEDLTADIQEGHLSSGLAILRTYPIASAASWRSTRRPRPLAEIRRPTRC